MRAALHPYFCNFKQQLSKVFKINTTQSPESDVTWVDYNIKQIAILKVKHSVLYPNHVSPFEGFGSRYMPAVKPSEFNLMIVTNVVYSSLGTAHHNSTVL